jgi:hypothetical protein
VRRAGGAGSRAATPAIATSPQAVRRTLRELHGCVASLPPKARSLLRQRAGSGRAEPRSLAALSVSLGIPRAGVIGRLRGAIGELRGVAQRTGCAGISIPADLQTDSSTPLGRKAAAPTADHSAVLGVSAHGGPSSQPGTVSDSEAAPRSAAEEAGPGDELLLALVLLMLAIVGVGGLASRRFGPSRRPRPRRMVTPRLYSLAMRAGFRYSQPRDALVLRGIGERFGPVLVRDGGRRRPRPDHPPVESGLGRAEPGASRCAPGDERDAVEIDDAAARR